MIRINFSDQPLKILSWTHDHQYISINHPILFDLFNFRNQKLFCGFRGGPMPKSVWAYAPPPPAPCFRHACDDIDYPQKYILFTISRSSMTSFQLLELVARFSRLQRALYMHFIDQTCVKTSLHSSYNCKKNKRLGTSEEETQWD